VRRAQGGGGDHAARDEARRADEEHKLLPEAGHGGPRETHAGLYIYIDRHVSMCVCVYIYIYIYINTYIYIYIYVYMCTYICIYVYMYICVYIYIYIDKIHIYIKIGRWSGRRRGVARGSGVRRARDKQRVIYIYRYR